MFPITRLGPLSLPSPELIVFGFFYLSLSLFERLHRSKGKDPEILSNLVLSSVFVFILVGRVGFVLENALTFLRSPIDIFSLNRDLFDPWLGGAAVAVFAILSLRKRGIELWQALDDLTIFLIGLALAGSIANIASGAAFGIRGELPFSIELWGARRFPVQFVDTAINLAVFLTTAILAKKPAPTGAKFLFTLFLFLAGQIVAQGFRAEGIILGGGLRLDQLIYFFLAGVVGWVLLRKMESANG